MYICTSLNKYCPLLDHATLEDLVYECKDCTKTLKDKKSKEGRFAHLDLHKQHREKYHLQSELMCKICDKKCQDLIALHRHEKYHEKKDSQNYPVELKYQVLHLNKHIN